MRRVLVPLVLASLLGIIVPGQPSRAVGPTLYLSKRAPAVTWTGSMTGVGAAPLGCHGVQLGCDERTLVVDAPKGDWITISLSSQVASLRVTSKGAYVGSGGFDLITATSQETPSTTFQQLASGRVSYLMQIGAPASFAMPEAPAVSSDSSYQGSARLAGKAFDRIGECGITPGAQHLLAADPGEQLRLSVRLVGSPLDAAAIKAAGRGLAETYRRINIRLRVTYDFREIVKSGDYPYFQVRRAYRGVRPPGVDVVHVMTDQFNGGFADCLGGVAYPEKAFSVGNVRYYTPGGQVTPVPGAVVAAHEIGHLLGAQHQQSNCAEALPQQALQRPSDGWIGPCTVMSPAALQASETFSTLERSSIRHFVRTYARG